MKWLEYLTQNRNRYTNELMDFLSIPDVSTDPEQKDDVARAAGWVASRLNHAGIESAKVMETGGHPVVYGEWLHAPNKPTVLIFGHFDVQPPDPLELWDSPPFEPTIKDGRVYARGASDQKANLLLAIIACEALLKTEGSLPVNVRFLFEGEEEIGSPSLPEFIERNKSIFECDMGISTDSGMFAENSPMLLVGLRGICAMQVDVKTAGTDLHSGAMGGIAPNAIHILVNILDSIRSEDGKILIDGFYDDVLDLSPETRTLMMNAPDNTSQELNQAGIKKEVGEPGFSSQERIWARPTLDINGIWSGYQGKGIKTVIPSEAHAKISCRLVSDQSPSRIIECVTAHIEKHCPPEAEVTVTPLQGRADPYFIPKDHPGMLAASKVLTRIYGSEPVYMWMGGSVPVTGILKKLLDIYTVSFGFSQPDENVHAPNEFMRLSNFDKGQQAFCMLLEELSQA